MELSGLDIINYLPTVIPGTVEIVHTGYLFSYRVKHTPT